MITRRSRQSLGLADASCRFELADPLLHFGCALVQHVLERLGATPFDTQATLGLTRRSSVSRSAGVRRSRVSSCSVSCWMTSTILAGLNGFGTYTPPAMLLFKAGAQADV